MITLRVETIGGKAVSGPAVTFNESGGTIGRSHTNQLALDGHDISRLQAQLVCRNGVFALIDRGSNPVLVNGRALGSGREAPLADGDRLTIGDYQILVTAGAPDRAAAMPAGSGLASPVPVDLFGGGFDAPAHGAGSAAGGLFGGGSALVGGGPLDDTPTTPIPSIPADWDFGTPTPASTPVVAERRSPVPPYPGPTPTFPGPSVPGPSGGAGLSGVVDPTPSLDDLFGLPHGAPTTAGDGGLFATGDAFGAPSLPPGSATDPLVVLQQRSARPVAAAPLPDHDSDLHAPWPAAPPLPAAPPVPVAPPATRPAPPPGAVLSWDKPPREGHHVTLPGSRPSVAAAQPAPPAPSDLTVLGLASKPAPPLAQAARADVPPDTRRPALDGPIVPPAPPAPPEALAPDALQRALALGLGVPAERLNPLCAAQLQLVGQLLREATQGAVHLLLARTTVKEEVGADVTRIGAVKNNPLKFVPSVEAALLHLLGPAVVGYMAPEQAMREAFTDLRAHQLAVTAGMRSALQEVLKRFDPARLEEQIAGQRSALMSLIPNARKAQLWEQFQQLYRQLSAEALDDFNRLYGQAFRAAYQAQIDVLSGADDPA